MAGAGVPVSPRVEEEARALPRVAAGVPVSPRVAEEARALPRVEAAETDCAPGIGAQQGGVKDWPAVHNAALAQPVAGSVPAFLAAAAVAAQLAADVAAPFLVPGHPEPLAGRAGVPEFVR